MKYDHLVVNNLRLNSDGFHQRILCSRNNGITEFTKLILCQEMNETFLTTILP